jgi:hypothetical protein
MLKCNTVLIKFLDKNLPQQEIRHLQTSFSVALVVERDNDFLILSHVSALGHVIKQLNFNIKDVKEYVCLEVQVEPA